MSQRLKTLLLCAMTSVLTACASASIKPTATNEYCRIAHPIMYSSKLDTPATVAAVEAHNSAWVCVCEGDCPRSP